MSFVFIIEGVKLCYRLLSYPLRSLLFLNENQNVREKLKILRQIICIGVVIVKLKIERGRGPRVVRGGAVYPVRIP